MRQHLPLLADIVGGIALLAVAYVLLYAFFVITP